MRELRRHRRYWTDFDKGLAFLAFMVALGIATVALFALAGN
jgi:hypothetical protein